MAGPYSFLTVKSDTLAADMAAGATSCTLTTGSFGTPTYKIILTVDANVPAKRADFECTATNTAITSMVLVNGPDVIHTSGAVVQAGLVKEHMQALRDGTGQNFGNTNYSTTLGYASDTTAAQTGITAAVDLTGLTVTVTVPAGGRRVRITGIAYGRSSVGTDVFSLSIFEGATQLAYDSIYVGDTSNRKWHVTVSLVPTAGSHTYKLNFGRSVGSGTWTNAASATGPASLLVDLI